MTSETRTSSDEATRLNAVRELARADSGDRADRLILALNDESWRVRREAVDALDARRGAESIGAVLRAMREHVADLGTLNSAIQVLSQAGVDTFGPLVEFLGDKEPELRVCAALTMGNQNDPRAVPALLQALDDPDSNVRYHAIEALGKLKSSAAVDSLLRLAESRDFALAFPALDALSSIGDARAALPLTALLDDPELRLPALEALGSLGGEDAVAPLIALLHDHRDLTAAVASALTRIRDRYEARYGRGDRIEAAVRQTITAVGTKSLIDAAAGGDGPELEAIARVLGWLESADVDRTLVAIARTTGESFRGGRRPGAAWTARHGLAGRTIERRRHRGSPDGPGGARSNRRREGRPRTAGDAERRPRFDHGCGGCSRDDRRPAGVSDVAGVPG